MPDEILIAGPGVVHRVDTTFLITHRSTDLADGPDLDETFKNKKDGCVKVVFHGTICRLVRPYGRTRRLPWLRKH